MDQECVERESTVPPAQIGRIGRQARTLLVVLPLISAAFVVLFTARMAVRCRHALPYWDQWDNLVTGRPLTWAWLVSQHNEHRILFPRLIFLADAWLFHERNDLDLVANFAIQLATASILTALGWRLIQPGWRGAIAIASLIFALMFSAVQWENFASAFQVQFFLVCFAAVASSAVFVDVRPAWLAFVGVILLEILAVFSLASGILVPVVMVALALWLRRPMPQIIVLTIAAALLLGAYLQGYVTPSRHSDPITALGDLAGLAAYVLNELGAFPEALSGHGSLRIHLVSGILGLFLFGLFIVTNRSRPGPAAKAEVPLLGIALFVLGMCVLTALGRARFGLEQANAGRYATAVLLFWIAILLVGVSRLRRQPRVWGLAGLGLLTIGTAILEPRLASPAIKFARSLTAAAPAVLVPNGDLALLGRLYPIPEVVTARLPLLQAARASIFAEPWSQWLNRPFPEGRPRPDLRPCAGDFTRLVPVADATRSGWRATGHLQDQDWPAARLVFLDAEARVVGLGLAGLDARAIGEDRTPNDAAPDRWLGEIIAVDPHSLRVYRLDGQDHPLCSLGTPP